MTSFNHYAFGAVADWLHRTVGGLAPAAPGYRTLRIAPRPGPGITSASTAHETPYGPAEVAWTLDGTSFTLDVSVPPNTTAEVSLPDGGEAFEVGSGRHSMSVSLPEPQPVERPQSFWTPPE
jgi:alpha-L-rhamnosidase